MANGLACHEHLPILVTRFLVPAAEEGERSGFYKYAMRTTIDFPIINFALRCGGNRPARLAAGAGFVVVETGAIMTMPGLPKVPAAEKIDVDKDGTITGLF